MTKLRAGIGLSFDDVLVVPRYTTISSRDDVSLSTELVRGLTIASPIVSAPMDTITEKKMALTLAQLGAIGIIHRYMTPLAQQEAVEHVKSVDVGLRVGAAIGINGNTSERIGRLVTAGTDLLVLDVAHADSSDVFKTLIRIKKSGKGPKVLVGNVVTKEAAELLVDAGADGIKVGIGPGAACTTRKMTGVGYPQISAIMDVVAFCDKRGIPVCADGGIKTSGDIVKALAAGASTVMVGSLFAGTPECPRWVRKGNNKAVFRGMASIEAKAEYGIKSRYNEGEVMLVDRKRSVVDIVEELHDGIRSGMSYGGSRTIKQFNEKGEFVVVTANTRRI